MLNDSAGATCATIGVIATDTGRGAATGIDGGCTGLTADSSGVASAAKRGGVTERESAVGARTVAGATEVGLTSPPGLPKVPAGKKNPGGGPADTAEKLGATTGLALPQACSSETAVQEKANKTAKREVNNLKVFHKIFYSHSSLVLEPV